MELLTLKNQRFWAQGVEGSSPCPSVRHMLFLWWWLFYPSVHSVNWQSPQMVINAEISLAYHVSFNEYLDESSGWKTKCRSLLLGTIGSQHFAAWMLTHAEWKLCTEEINHWTNVVGFVIDVAVKMCVRQVLNVIARMSGL